jgi:hypothetical protein
MKENPIQKRILLACSRGNTRLWRNNCGALQDKRGRWVRFGVASPGGSDLIGWTTVKIRPEDVGKEFAVFTALEVKTAKGRVKKEQQQFIDNVQLSGGIGAIVRSADEAQSVLTRGRT